MLKTFCLDFECKEFTVQPAVNKARREPRFFVEGFASTDLLDLVDDIITLDALRAAASDLLKNNSVFLNHDRKDLIGSVVDAKFIEGKGLWIRILISATRKDIQQLIRENALNKLSIGGQVLATAKGKHPKTGKEINFIVRIKLHEVSMVSLPANQDARSLSWSLEKGTTRTEQTGGDSKVKIKVKADGQGRPIIRNVDGVENYVGWDGEGSFVELEANKAQADAPAGGGDAGHEEPEIQAGFDFDEKELEAIEAETKAEAESAVRFKQISRLCQVLIDGPSEDAAKIGKTIKGLVPEKLFFGQTQEADKGIDADAMSLLVRKAVAEAMVDLIPAAGVQRGRPAPKGTRKGAPDAGGDDAPLTEDDKLKAALEAAPKGHARLAILSNAGKLFRKLD